jgi:uncharacterized membrane protein YdfJ with MMPL/SSD domain
VILAGTFAVLAITGNSDTIRQLGFGVAAGILMDTFLIRTLLIPAVVVLLGRWNWWPSRLSAGLPPAAAEGSVSGSEGVTSGTISTPMP